MSWNIRIIIPLSPSNWTQFFDDFLISVFQTMVNFWLAKLFVIMRLLCRVDTLYLDHPRPIQVVYKNKWWISPHVLPQKNGGFMWFSPHGSCYVSHRFSICSGSKTGSSGLFGLLHGHPKVGFAEGELALLGELQTLPGGAGWSKKSQKDMGSPFSWRHSGSIDLESHLKLWMAFNGYILAFWGGEALGRQILVWGNPGGYSPKKWM